MPQESGPLQGTNFTDAQWRAIFGGEPGIVGDVNGSAYNITLPSGSNDAVLGSSSQDSTSVVAGYMHRIAQGQTQTITIPPSTNAIGRTDIIVVRFDSGSFTSAPGPCRLYRVAGVEGSTARPSLDESPPGVEDLPLWAVTRKGNGTTAEGLNQAVRVDLRRRTGPSLVVPAGEPLPPNVPIGTRARRAGVEFSREFVGSAAEWVQAGTSADWTDVPTQNGFANGSGWSTLRARRTAGVGVEVSSAFLVRGSSAQVVAGTAFAVGTLPVGLRPSKQVPGSGTLSVGGTRAACLVFYQVTGRIDVVPFVSGTMGTYAQSGPYTNFISLDSVSF